MSPPVYLTILAFVSFFCSLLVSKCAKKAILGAFSQFAGIFAIKMALSCKMISFIPNELSSSLINLASSYSVGLEGMMPFNPFSLFVVVLNFV